MENTDSHRPNDQARQAKAYTVNEIDALRNACEDRWLYGTTNITTSRFSRQYYGSEKDKGVEEMVRTYMIAGLTAEDLYAADKPTLVLESVDSTTA